MKLILVSILFVTVLVPTLAARIGDERRGLRRTLFQMAMFIALWIVATRFL